MFSIRSCQEKEKKEKKEKKERKKMIHEAKALRFSFMVAVFS